MTRYTLPNNKTITSKEITDKFFYPKSHLRLYAYLTITRFYHPTLSIETWTRIVYDYFEKDFGKTFAMGEWIKNVDQYTLAKSLIETSRLHRPTLTQMSHALQAMGLARAQIAEILGCTPANVSYHLSKKEPERTYTNMYWANIQKGRCTGTQFHTISDGQIFVD